MDLVTSLEIIRLMDDLTTAQRLLLERQKAYEETLSLVAGSLSVLVDRVEDLSKRVRTLEYLAAEAILK